MVKKNLFKMISKEKEENLLRLIESDDTTNWLLAFKLLRGIKGIGRHLAEEWIYLQFKNTWAGDKRSLKFNDFCNDYFKLGRRDGIDSYYINSETYNKIFINGVYGKFGGRSIGKTYLHKFGKNQAVTNTK